MAKKLFDRNDPNVIASAKECDTVEDFIQIYKGITTATEKTLNKAYHELKHGKMAAIRMMSGSTDNDNPIEPLVGSVKNEQKSTQEKSEIMAKKEEKKTVAQDATPLSQKRVETHNGEQVLVGADYIDPEVVEELKAEREVLKTTPKASPIQSKEKPTKQSKIRLLLANGATNKEIKLLLKEEGLKCYDSEILSAKTYLKKQLENKGE